MPDMQRFINTLKQIAANERQAALPMTICFGKVVALSPFRVQIDQKLVLTKEFFIVKSGVSASTSPSVVVTVNFTSRLRFPLVNENCSRYL